MKLEHHEQVSRGWYFPEVLVNLWERGKITKVEFFLLGFISSISPGGECWATNEYIGEKVNMSPKSVSSYVTKFKKMGLVGTGPFNGRRRLLLVLFQGDFILKEQKRKNSSSSACTSVAMLPAQKRAGSLHKNVQAQYTTYTLSNEKSKIARACARTSSSSSGFGLNDKKQSNTESSKLCDMLEDIIRKTRKLVKVPNRTKWNKDMDQIIEMVDGDTNRIGSVLRWYSENSRSRFVPTVYSASDLMKKFVSIERLMEMEDGDDEPKETRVHVTSEEGDEVDMDWEE